MAEEGVALLHPKFGMDRLEKTNVDKKRLAELLLDPRFVAIAESCPEKKEAIAHMIRKLQAEREMKRNRREQRKRQLKVGEDGREAAWTSKLLSTFDCTNIMRMFLAQPREARPRRGCCRNNTVTEAGDASDSMFEELRESQLIHQLTPRNNFTSQDIQIQQAIQNIKLNGVKVHLNGIDLPHSSLLTQKCVDIAEVFLKKANMNNSTTLFSFLPKEARSHVRIIHDLQWNDLTNRKTVSANLIPKESHSAVIVLEPVKVTEVPVYSIPLKFNDSVYSIKKYSSSCTQTDFVGYFCCECALSNDSYSTSSEANNDLRSNIRNMKSMTQIHSYSLKKNVFESHGEPSVDSPKEDNKYSAVEHRDSCSTSEDSESNSCSPLDVNLGAHFISKIIKYSKGPDKKLISPEVVITCSGKRNCTGKCCESDGLSSTSCHASIKASNSSSDTITFDGTNQAHKWPRKRMKTSCESYYADESNVKLDQPFLPKGYTTNHSTELIRNNFICGQRPPEISTGYSQLSCENSGNFNASENENDEIAKTRNINICNEAVTSSNGNYETEGNFRFVLNHSESIESVDFDQPRGRCYGSESRTDYISYQEDENGNEWVKSEDLRIAVSQKLQSGVEARVQECPEFNHTLPWYTMARRSFSAMSVLKSPKSSKEVHRYPNNGRTVLRAQNDFKNGEENGNTSSGVDQEYIDELVNKTSVEPEDISSSEEEHRRLYERNLEAITMKIKSDEDKSSSSSRPATPPPLPPWKMKRLAQRSRGKSKEKPKHKRCSIM